MKKRNNFLVKLGDFITNARYVSLVLMLCLTVFCFININNVSVNESIVSYLPDDTETKSGMDLMEDEFGSLKSISLMVEDISLEKANVLSKKLSKVDKVEAVLFDGSANSYKNNKALYQIELKNIGKNDIDTIKKDIENTVKKEKYHIYSEEFEDATEGISIVLAIACVIIITVLTITSKTYFEPVIAFIIFGISIILNMGSNFLLGEISYITKSIAVVLQLALSIDYVIIFMNQYMKEISDTDGKILAIKKTVTKAMPEIFASSLTTVSGLMALCFMQLKLGGDIGIVLSKGIICSLVTVILIMPSLLAIFNKQIIALKKKDREKSSSKLADMIFRSRKPLLTLFAIVVVFSCFLMPKYNYVYNPTSAKSIRQSENAKSLEKIENEFGKSNTLVVLFKNSEKDYNKELNLVNDLKELNNIGSITSIGGYKLADNVYLGTEFNYLEIAQMFKIEPEISANLFKLYAKENNELEKLASLDDYKVTVIDMLYFLKEKEEILPLTDELKTQIDTYYNLISENIKLLESDNYTRLIINLNSKQEDKKTYKLIDDIRKKTEKKYDGVKLIGNSINAVDLESSFTSDNLIITGITILFIAIILLFTFKSVGMTLLLILAIEGSILINFGIIALAGKEIFFMGYVVVSAIQMGATIDYAIVIASRYMELRKKIDKKDAIIETLNDRLPAVITSGLILVVSGFLIGFISTSSVISQIGLYLGLGTLISLITTIFVLPAILYVFDKLIEKTTFIKK